MPNVKWTQNIYTLDRYNRCLIDCPVCHVFQYDRAYGQQARQIMEVNQEYMNLKTTVYEVVCPSCNNKFQLLANQKKFDGQYETVYLSVPILQNKKHDKTKSNA